MFTCLKKRHKKERCVLPLGVLCFSSFNDMHRLLNKKKKSKYIWAFFTFFIISMFVAILWQGQT